MKHIKTVILLLLIIQNVYSQQRPQYSQYVLNNYLLNPALSGIENYTDTKIGYRNQWSGLSDAPVTSFATINWALGSSYLWKNALSFDEGGDNPMNRNYMQNYTSSAAHHGVGITLVSDKAGQISNQVLNFTYAYHLQLTGVLNLSVGLSAGVNRIGIDGAALLMERPNDPALQNTVKSQIKPDLAFGLWLYGARFFAGFSAQQFLVQPISFTQDGGYNQGMQARHFFLTAGYKFFVSDEINLLPSVLFKYVPNVPISADLMLKAGFKDQVWIGAGYRKNDSSILMAGFNLGHLVNVTYAYDFTHSALSQVSNGSHEIVLGFMFNNIYKVICPQKMW